MENLLWFLVTGLIVGWLAGVIVKGSGFGIVGDIAVGAVGAVLGGWLAGLVGVGAYSRLGSYLVSILGAVLLVWLLRTITGGKPA